MATKDTPAPPAEPRNIKIKLTRHPLTGGGSVSERMQTRVMSWPADMTLPQTAEPMPDDMPESDWHEEESRP